MLPLSAFRPRTGALGAGFTRGTGIRGYPMMRARHIETCVVLAHDTVQMRLIFVWHLISAFSRTERSPFRIYVRIRRAASSRNQP